MKKTTLSPLERMMKQELNQGANLAALPESLRQLAKIHYDWQVEVDRELELETDSESKARETYVRFDMAKCNVSLYRRPIGQTGEWEEVDSNF